MDISGKSSRSAQSPATPAKVSRSLLLATDLQQSILAELEQSGANRRAYSAYGMPSSQRPPGSRLGFNGQLRERSTGCYHLGNGHRVYNPVLMRFHSPDRLSPFGKGGINAYAYCQGDPINFTDPTGRFLNAVISAVYQRSMTVAFHIGIPTGLMLAPPATGVGLIGTRVSLIGSAVSATAAILQISGVSAGMYVANVGLSFSVGGFLTRLAPTAYKLYQDGQLWNRFKTNVKNVFGFPPPADGGAPSPPLPAANGPDIHIPMDPVGVSPNSPQTSYAPQDTARNIRSS